MFTKGEDDARYERLFDRFWSIYDTGLTEILGGRGVIEDRLTKIFWESIFPDLETWEKYATCNPEDVQHALLRFVVNHLLHTFDDVQIKSFPEEFYILPSREDDIRTGMIVKELSSDRRFVVLTPDCDLMVRRDKNSGKETRNTYELQIVEALKANSVVDWFGELSLNELTKSQMGKIDSLLGNKRQNLHCLPQTKRYPLRFLNFRTLMTVTIDEFWTRFEKPSEAQIAPMFVKDIVARFSAYYGRQGQPDIDFLAPRQS